MSPGSLQFELKDVRPEDRPVVARMLGTASFKEFIWDWQFAEGEGRVSPVGAYLDDRLVGFNGLMPVQLRFDGSRREAAWSCDFIVDPEFRRHGAGRALKQELDRRCPLILALGTSTAANAVLPKAGWIAGQGPVTMVRYNKGGGVRRRLRRLVQGFHLLLRLPLRLGRSSRKLSVLVAPDLPPDEALDALWASAESGYRRCVVRNARYLRWRYASHPAASYSFIQVRHGDRLVALGVERWSGRQGVLVDYVGPAEDAEAKRAVVRSFVSRADHSESLDCTTSDRQLRSLLAVEGFLQGSGRVGFFLRVNEGPPATDPGAGWFLMGGDSDGELLAASGESALRVREWTEEEFAAGRGPWEALLGNSDADPLFMGWDWQYLWWKHFGLRNRLRLRLFAAYGISGELVGLAPFFEHDVNVLGVLTLRRLEPVGNIWGGPYTMRSEYLSLILRRDSTEETGRRLWLHIIGASEWDDLYFQDWDLRATGGEAMVEVLRSRCLTFEFTDPEADVARHVPLQAGFKSYLASLSANARRSLYNRRNYLQELGAVTRELARASEVRHYFDDLNRLHQLRWGAPVFEGHRLAFHLELAEALANHGRLRFSRLSLDGRAISMIYDLCGQHREYNLQMGFDDTFHAGKLSLGLLHLGYEFERAAAEGMSAVDLLAGKGKQEYFKSRIAPGGNQLARVHFVRSTTAKIYFNMLHGLKRLVGRDKGSRVLRGGM